MIKKALISVSDKTGIVELAKRLDKMGIEILSTGGTAKKLKSENIKVTDVSDYTGSPEIMNGRVKTLHPKVHGGILAVRNNEEHVKQAKENNIDFIDLLIINLYPFKETISKPNVTIEDAIENIDIGGPTMLRSGAKNFKFVTVVTDINDYENVISEIEQNGNTSFETRKNLAIKVFTLTNEYDTEIEKYLRLFYDNNKIINLKYYNAKALRYGENWHQKANVYNLKKISKINNSLLNSEILHGKEMSFNNYIDSEASFSVASEYTEKIAVSVIKHTNPCGFSTGETVYDALKMAWEGDIVSAFGSIISVNNTFDLKAAEFLKGKFVEAVIAYDYTDDALEYLKNKSKNLRIIKINKVQNNENSKMDYKIITGGLLEQDKDNILAEKYQCVTENKFDENKKKLAEFSYIACKHTKSNAIIIAYEYIPNQFMVLGMGAGQPNRVDSIRKLAVTKAKENIERLFGKNEINKIMSKSVLASDAFFPFSDSIDYAKENNIKYIIQPGGSVRDNEVITSCNNFGISMLFTGTRHFLH